MTEAKRSTPTPRPRRGAIPYRALGMLCAVAVLCGSPALASGADFAAGTWTGKLERTKKKAQRARLVLKEDENGSVEIGELIVNKQRYEVGEFGLKKNKLWFTWEPGDEPVRCDLKWKKKKEHFEGPCKVEGGPEIATLTVVPPQEKDVAADADDPPAKGSGEDGD